MKENNSLTIKGIRLVAVLLLLGVIMGNINFVLSKLLSSESQFKSIITVVGVLAVISVLIVLYGIYLIVKGRTEFSPSHEKNVIIAKKLILSWIILFVLTGFFILPFSSAFPVIKTITDIILVIPFGLVFVYLIKELTEKNIKKLLWLTFFIYIITNSITSYANFIDAKNEAGLFYLYLISTLIGFIPSLILVFCYYKTYIKLKKASTLA